MEHRLLVDENGKIMWLIFKRNWWILKLFLNAFSITVGLYKANMY